VLFKDPLGGLDPWIEATGDRAVDTTALAITAGLFGATGSALSYAGQRRRSDGEIAAKRQRKYRFAPG
jgi:hypothetical protein